MTYKGQAYPFDPEALSYPEALAFQAETKMKIGQWLTGLNDGDVASLMAAVWLCLWRDDKTIRFQNLVMDPELRPLVDVGIEDDEDAKDEDEDKDAGPDPTVATPDSLPLPAPVRTKVKTNTKPT